MLSKFVLLTWFITSAPLLADTLLSGSIYFDSQKTLEEVVKLSAAKDNESILKLINSGHVSQQTETTKEIVILATGVTSESPAEFRFTSEPTTYWTLTKFVTREAAVEPTVTPAPEQSPTSAETAERASAPAPAETPERASTAAPAKRPERASTRTERRRLREPENNDPTDDDNGQRIWHKVDGRWKWYPAHRKPVRKALPPDQNPRVTPASPSTPQ